MEEDVKAADLVLWVGISFQQSASTMYFRKVRAWIQVGGWSCSLEQVPILCSALRGVCCVLLGGSLGCGHG